MAYKNLKDQQEYRKRWLQSADRPKAKCHPDKPHAARGLCSKCYDTWLYANSGNHRSNRLLGAKKWKQNNEDKVKKLSRNSKLLYKYGISEADYSVMYVSQKGKCKICGATKPERELHVDHCHSTGKIRGLLCLRCNGSLAWVEEILKKKKSEWYENALKYLGYEH